MKSLRKRLCNEEKNILELFMPNLIQICIPECQGRLMSQFQEEGNGEDVVNHKEQTAYIVGTRHRAKYLVLSLAY